MVFDFDFFISILPDLMGGLWITLKATAGGYLVAVAVGLLLAMAGRSKFSFIRWFCKVYVTVMRCTPMLVQLYVAYYILPRIGLRFDALLTGILALGLYTGAYMSEVFRAGIDSVSQGQWEASKALGLKPSVIWFKVILPQVIPVIFLPMGNYLIGMFKETPLLAAITVLDLMGTASDIAGQTYKYTEPYTAVALILLSISIVTSIALRLFRNSAFRWTRVA